MRRILMVSGVAALMAALMALMAAPAMARDFDFNDHDKNDHDGFVFFGDDNDHDNFRGFNNFGGFNLDNENELESGAVNQDFSVRNTGDYANQCVPAVQFGNTGNFNNAPSFAQFGSGGGFFDDRRHRGFFNHRGIGDFEPGGIEFSVSPEVAVDCSSTIQQSSAASSTPYWR